MSGFNIGTQNAEQIKNINVESGDYIEKQEITNVTTNIRNFYEFKQLSYQQYITNLYNKIDSIEPENIELYKQKVNGWLPNWKKLSLNSQKYIVSGEYIYSKYQEIQGIEDYSPFVLQFCRVIENELGLLLQNLTVDYENKVKDPAIRTNQLKEAKTQSESRLKGDAKGGISKLVKYIKNESNCRNKKILADTIEVFKGLAEAQNQPWQLIQYINSYLDTKINRAGILDSVYIQKIDNMRNKYRNSAAHSEIILKREADIFRELMCKEILPVWADNTK